VRRIPNTLMLVSVTVATLLIAGCGSGGPIGVQLRPEVERPDRGVVLFICDGLSVDTLDQGLVDGRFPNIQRRFIVRGTRVEHAVTAVPSITYAILTTYATGVVPARHGVIANAWFDRGLRLARDYGFIRNYRNVNADFNTPTIYERIQPKVSVSIQDAIHRGVTRNVANWAQSGVRWFFHDYTAVDKLTATTVDYVARWSNRNGVWPDLLVCYFPGLDSVGHAAGVDSDRYQSAAEHIDYQVGRVCNWLGAEGLLDTTTIILVADHGMTPVHAGNTIDLARILRTDMHRRVTEPPYQDPPFETRYHHFKRFDTVLARCAERFAAIHFRGELGWNDPLSPDDISAVLDTPPPGRRLQDHPGVDLLVFASGDGEVELRSPRGTARIEERTTAEGVEYRYVPVPDDVFGYLADPDLARFVNAGFHSSRDWLAATCEAKYPDVVPQLVPLMRARRSGDVVLFAAHGYSFGDEKSGHGGIHRAEMRIPMMFAGPGIELGATIDTARAVDLVPTIMRLLGCDVPDDDSLDGRPLLPAPTGATKTLTETP